ncbi:hypothetical protein SGLAD_v1c08350 [Spiroplasma gladiatoris]|uniref:Uncharacterized protein n=1 Tax=Spiroplasma gladiatoris TaxID=2143 RepID=A0A4P7AHW4_9MOLU|nr:hypothetical protein [Spiroplasma gladiatoris]QBQ08034.1 hypothetical protein SGLAD_v1c08350 [Spiroplasma gladiatoris]
MFNSIRSIKTFTIIGAVFGIIVTLVGMFFLLFDVLKDLDLAIIFASLVVFFGSLTIGFSIYIIVFASRTDDETFANNRFILMLFSLSVGGLLTPYLLMKLPNTNVTTTIQPRVAISKGYGTSFFASGLATLATFFALTLTSETGLEAALTGTNKYAYIAIVAVSGVAFLWGLINVITFFGKQVDENFEKEGNTHNWMMVISTINLIIGTITLIWIIINSVLSIIAAIMDLFDRRRGFLMAILNGALIALRIAMYCFIIYTASQCIKGIWSKKGYTYGNYQNLTSRQQEFNNSRERG